MFLECSEMFDRNMEYIRDNANVLTICHTQPTNYTDATSTFTLAARTVESSDYTLLTTEKLMLNDIELTAEKTGRTNYFALCRDFTDLDTGITTRKVICTGDFTKEIFTIGETYVRDVTAMENEGTNSIIIDSCTVATNTSFGHLQSVNDGLGQSFECNVNCHLDSCSFILRRCASSIVTNAYIEASLYFIEATSYKQNVKLEDGLYHLVDVLYEIPKGDPIAVSEPIDIENISYYPDYWEPVIFKFSGLNRIELTPGFRYIITIQGAGPGYGYTGNRDFVYVKYATKKTSAKGNLCQRDPVKNIWASSGWYNPYTDQDDIDSIETWYGNSDLLFAVYGTVLLNQVILNRVFYMPVTP